MTDQTAAPADAGGAPINPAGSIDSWADWPADVEPILRAWNRKEQILRFDNCDLRPFQCQVCRKRCARNRYGAAEMFGKPLCDDCLIELARPVSASLAAAREEANFQTMRADGLLAALENSGKALNEKIVSLTAALAAAREEARVAQDDLQQIAKRMTFYIEDRDAATARAAGLRIALVDLLVAECLCPPRDDGACNTSRHNEARAALASAAGVRESNDA